MYNWNAVFLRYCDGSSLSSDKTTPAIVGNETIYYRGRAILDAEIKSLLNDRGMNQATDVVVSGCSAGGLATFLHCDKWSNSITNATVSTINQTAKVVCMPESGFFVDQTLPEGDQYGEWMRYIYFFQETSPEGLNEDCYKAHLATNDTEACMLAEHTSPYIKTPMFPIQSKYDSCQFGMIGKPTDAVFNEYGKNLTHLLVSTLLSQPQHGAFLDACFNHCGNWDGPIIDQMTTAQAFEAWYNGGSQSLQNKGFFNQEAVYPCDACCGGF